MKPYEKLAKIYDKDWGQFSPLYLRFIDCLNEKHTFKPTSVLDIACGTGKLASELYKLNYDVTGIDISTDMINTAKSNYPKIQFDVADMTDLHIDRRFDLITCAFDSINYLSEDEQVLKTLANIHFQLNDQGYFIFDINTPALYEEKHFGIIEREIEDIKFKQVLEYDKEKRIASTVFDFGNDEQEVHIQKAYSYETMDTFLTKSNFMILERFKDFNLSPVDEDSYKIFYIVKKI